MNRAEHLREWLTHQWRPWHTSCLPEELALPGDGALQFDAEKMLRDARLGSSCDLKLGVFQILGVEETHHAARLWWPPTWLISEEVSLAFRLVERQRLRGEIVSGHNIARLTETLFAYFKSMGRLRSREAIRGQIDAWLAKNALPDAESISPVRQPIVVELPLLDELRQIDKEVRARFTDWHGRPATLDCVGLILNEKLDDSRYDHCTPLNCRTFAHTGGDGAHFSLLVVDGAITEHSPIIATAPDCYENPSVVVAESLRQFLCVGCEKGYFSLGYTLHGTDSMIQEYFGPVGELPVAEYLIDDFQIQVLAYLKNRLKLEPYKDWRKIQQLQGELGPSLRHPPGAVIG